MYISAVNRIICNYSTNNGWLEKFDAEKRGAGSKLLAWARGGGQRAGSLLRLGHPKISSVPRAPLGKHWPQLAAKAGQEFIFISWNSVDLKSLLNVNFQKTHASAF